jgi:hypothetical protein
MDVYPVQSCLRNQSMDGHNYIPANSDRAESGPRIPMANMHAYAGTPITGWSKVDVTVRSRKQGSDKQVEENHDSDTEEDDDSSVGHFSDPKEFDENDDDSEPSCNPMCPMPCQKHGAGYPLSEDSDVVSTVEPESVNDGARPDANLGEAQRDRVTGLVANRIREYLSLLDNPTRAGDYRRGGVTLSTSEIEKCITHLRKYQ